MSWGNPGKNISESYVSGNALDIFQISETDGYPTGTTIGNNTFNGTYPTSRFAIGIYNAPTYNTALIEDFATKAQYIFVTSDVGPNPYDTVSEYIDDLILHSRALLGNKQKYSLRQYLTTLSIHKYNIIQILAVIQASIQKYNVRQYLAQTNIHKYSLRAYLAQTTIQKYNLRKYLVQTTIQKYNLLKYVVQSSIQKYNISKSYPSGVYPEVRNTSGYHTDINSEVRNTPGYHTNINPKVQHRQDNPSGFNSKV